MARREKLFLGSSLLHSWFLMILNVLVSNMLLQKACKTRQKYVRTTDENDPKMVPKPLQNWSWRGSGGHLGATLETRFVQDLIFCDFGSIWGSPLGPVCWSVFLMALAMDSQNTSKMRPKRGPKPKAENHRCCFYLLYCFATFRGAGNHHLLMFLWNTVLGWLLEPILMIWAHFWGPFWRPCWSLFRYHFCIDF